MQITPKALTALQKLLSVNSPIYPHEMRNQEHSDSKSNQKSQQCLSSCQQDGISNRLKQKFTSPQEGIESLLRLSNSKTSLNGKPQGNVKNELINGLKQNQNVKENTVNIYLRILFSYIYILKCRIQYNINYTIKRNGNSFNQLLQPQINVPQKEQSAKIDYKKKRPPQLCDIVQDDDNTQQKKIVTSKSLQKSPNNVNKIGSGFFTSTHQKQNHMNVQYLLQLLLYLDHQMISQDNISNKKVIKDRMVCQKQMKSLYYTARNQEENKVNDNKLHSVQIKRISQTNYSNLLQELYLKTSKILHSYQTKETLWKQEKNSLKEEVNFLKQLLQQQQEESNQKYQR